jgi:hypothetical protein
MRHTAALLAWSETRQASRVRGFPCEARSPSYLRSMILKPYVDREERDPRRAAGRRAERQMAHYFGRHFHDRKKLHVLHDVRMEHEGEVAQMDHLVVHGFGIAIVESKSVSTSVRINAAGEWERQWDGRWRGMPDPILQGERQGLVLKRLLGSRESELLDKLLGVIQGTFRFMALDAFAAISDEGTIGRAKVRQAPRALKADAIPKAIEDLVASYRRDTRFLNPNLKAFAKAPRDFNDAELLRIGHFLRVRSAEVPAERTFVPEPATPSRPEVPVATAAAAAIRTTVFCKSCGGTDLEAAVGKYGPYAKCRSCSVNTSVKAACNGCRERVRLVAGPGGFDGRCSTCDRPYEIRFGVGAS